MVRFGIWDYSLWPGLRFGAYSLWSGQGLLSADQLTSQETFHSSLQHASNRQRTSSAVSIVRLNPSPVWLDAPPGGGGGKRAGRELSQSPEAGTGAHSSLLTESHTRLSASPAAEKKTHTFAEEPGSRVRSQTGLVHERAGHE